MHLNLLVFLSTFAQCFCMAVATNSTGSKNISDFYEWPSWTTEFLKELYLCRPGGFVDYKCYAPLRSDLFARLYQLDAFYKTHSTVNGTVEAAIALKALIHEILPYEAQMPQLCELSYHEDPICKPFMLWGYADEIVTLHNDAAALLGSVQNFYFPSKRHLAALIAIKARWELMSFAVSDSLMLLSDTSSLLRVLEFTTEMMNEAEELLMEKGRNIDFKYYGYPVVASSTEA